MDRSANCVDSLCGEVDGYPEELINDALNQNHEFDSFFKVSIDIHNRVNVNDTEQTLCQARKKVFAPKIGKNVNDEYKLIVNTRDNVQMIEGYTCE